MSFLPHRKGKKTKYDNRLFHFFPMGTEKYLCGFWETNKNLLMFNKLWKNNPIFAMFSWADVPNGT